MKTFLKNNKKLLKTCIKKGQALVYLKDKSGRFIRESQAWYQLCDLKLRKGKISKAKQTVPGRVFVSFKIQMARVSHETGESDDERDTVFLKVMRPYPENEDIVLKPPDRVDVTEEEGNIE